MPACPNCGEANPENARFCLACGTALPTNEGEPQRRKTVTVLFADVVGSTSLGEAMDPESVRALMTSYFERARRVLQRHGGTVEKFIGDAVMAVFGIPQAHEDDALRAVRAALELQEEVAALNAEAGGTSRGEISVRVGVNTGEVVAGDPASEQTLVTGDPVNTAARLEESAGPGEVLLGTSTQALVRDAVETEALVPLEVKGKREPLPAFRLLEVRPGVLGRQRRLDSPMVGREHELASLDDRFAEVAEAREPRLVSLLGAAGVGKSRLASEFLNEAGDRAMVLAGRCLPYGEGITYWPVVEIVREAAGIVPGDTAVEGAGKIGTLLGAEEHAALITERVAQVMGFSESTGEGEETFWAVRKLLEILARRRPLVLVLDDLHWGMPTFLDFVEYVSEWARGAPLFLLCMARPELLDSRPSWGQGAKATTIHLEPLALEESDLLIGNLLGRGRLEQDLQRRLVEAAEGTPLFIEEVLGMLIDDGLLEREDGRWVTVGDLSKIPIPPTIQALVSARLDRLSPDERGVIERAAVVGKVFYRGAVTELIPETLRPRVGAHLMALVRRGLVQPDRADLPGEDAFRFHHILVRDAAYEAIPKATRSDLHRRFAAWLEKASEERAVEYEEIVGFHLEQAFRYREELGTVDAEARALARESAGHLASVARRASARMDAPAVVNLLSRALSLVPADDPLRMEHLPDLGEALMESGELDRADEVLSEAMALASAAGDAPLAFRARSSHLRLRLAVRPEGVSEEMKREAERALPELEVAGDDLGLSKAWILLSEHHLTACRGVEMERALERALAHARRAGARREESYALSWMAAAIAWGPIPASSAIRRCQEVVERLRGHPLGQGFALLSRALVEATLGDFETARRSVEEGQRLLEGGGWEFAQGGVSYAAGHIEWLAGEAEAAEQQWRQGYELLQRLGERSYLSTIAGELAQVACATGRYEEAERYATRSAETAAPDDIASQALWRQVRSKILAHGGDLDRALRLVDQAVELTRESDFVDVVGGAQMDAAEVHWLAGRTQDAVEHAEQAVRLFERKGNVPSAARARQLLAELDAG